MVSRHADVQKLGDQSRFKRRKKVSCYAIRSMYRPVPSLLALRSVNTVPAIQCEHCDTFSGFKLGGMGVAAFDFLNLWVISDCCCGGEGDEVYRGIVEACRDLRACPPPPPFPRSHLHALFARLALACSLPVSLPLQCSGILWACRNASFLGGVFPMFVPSLSW
eukprot:COSAG06_NODE_2151_length_7467_cov_2.755836_8_plen_164_part_00